MTNKLIVNTDEYVSPFETAIREHIPAAGDIYLDRTPSCNGAVIIRLDSRIEERPGCWNITLLEGNRSDKTISEDTLKRYYRPLLGNYEETMTRAREIADGNLQTIASLTANTAPSAASEELIATESPEHIKAVLDSSENLKNRLEEIHLAAHIIIENKKAELDNQLREMNRYLQEMKSKVRNIVKVITILNLYTGQTVELNRLTEGEGASPDTPLSLRQRILFMDEELCVHLDYEVDYKDIPTFFEWLKEPKNRDIVIPEPRSIVTLKPKRFNMDYRSGDYTYDKIRNEWNRHTYILLRNGDNLWWAESEDLEVWDWAFPHEDFEEAFQKSLEKDRSFVDRRIKQHDAVKYRITKYMTFIQGLLDQRPDIIGTTSVRPNLLKLTGVRLIRDDENLIGTGRKPWGEFVKEKNESIRRGTRIVYIAGKAWDKQYYDHRQCADSGGFLKFYFNRYSWPDMPSSGIYNADTVEVVDHYEKGNAVKRTYEHLIFRYSPSDTVFDRSTLEEHERKNKISWVFSPRYVINYDAVTLEELRGYLEDRTLRPDFASMLTLLKEVLRQKEREMRDEDAFKHLLSEDILRETGSRPDETTINEAIDWWKGKVIFSRPLRSDDAKAWRMIRQYIKNKQ